MQILRTRAEHMVSENSRPADGMLLRLCAGLAVLGAVLLVGSNILGSILLDSHDWVSDTVSDLAAGDLEIIQDVGLYGYAAGLIALAIGAAHIRVPGKSWTMSIFALALLALCVTVIGARNEYGDNDSEGVEIHIYIVYALGALFTLLFFAAARGVGLVGRRFRRFSKGCGIMWAIAAPLFFVLPTSFDGAWERGLGLITVAWVVMAAWVLMRLASVADTADRPRRCAHDVMRSTRDFG